SGGVARRPGRHGVRRHGGRTRGRSENGPRAGHLGFSVVVHDGRTPTARRRSRFLARVQTVATLDAALVELPVARGALMATLLAFGLMVSPLFRMTVGLE